MTEQIAPPVPVDTIPPPNDRDQWTDALAPLSRLAAAHADAKADEARWREYLYDEVAALVDYGVPKTYIAETAGLSRTQVDRVLDRRTADA